MALIQANSEINVLKIKEFKGLNENPDGNTNIQTGELSEMRNFRITRDKHLQIRPGTKTIVSLQEAWNAWAETNTTSTDAPRFCGAWYGKVGDAYHTIAAYGGVLFDVDLTGEAPTVIGTCTQDDTSFFGFEGNVYLLNGHDYLYWDGTSGKKFAAVSPYVPTIQTATTPGGSGTALENVNRLTNLRKVAFSPDGTEKVFQLPEKDIADVTEVSGTSISYTVDKPNGKVAFSSAPTKGTNTVEITYQKGDGAANEVKRMRFAELFNGTTDSRVFLYGDGTNKTIYSGVELNTGRPTAAYFPDLYEASIGEENTPITSIIRHHSRLMVFKTTSAWSLQHELVTLANGAVTAAFYVTPVNRQIGNAAPGQVRLLENNPLTLFEKSVYQWKATSTSGNIVSDASNAGRISDRVGVTLGGFDLPNTKTFNRQGENEYWFLYGGKALILNYASNAWYLYNGMPFTEMLEISSEVYGFTDDGKVVHVSRQYRNDDGEDIDAYAATGSMDFDKDWLLKYSPMVFVAIQPESGARINVTVETNRRSDYPDKVVAAGISSFTHVNFAHFSFRTNRKPQVRRVKLKVKKATFYKLIYKSCSASATATVLETDVKLRYAGNVK